MDNNVKKLWVEALRSGKYEQGKNALRSVGNKFCCLGVLCDLYDIQFNLTSEWKPSFYPFYIEGDNHVYSFYNAHVSLPLCVLVWSGLSNDYKIKINQNSLAKANDIDGLNFNQIADLIEKS